MFCAFEIKVPNAKTARDRATLQLEWREHVRRAGGLAFEVRSLTEAVDMLSIALRGAS